MTGNHSKILAIILGIQGGLDDGNLGIQGGLDGSNLGIQQGWGLDRRMTPYGGVVGKHVKGQGLYIKWR